MPLATSSGASPRCPAVQGKGHALTRNRAEANRKKQCLASLVGVGHRSNLYITTTVMEISGFSWVFYRILESSHFAAQGNASS